MESNLIWDIMQGMEERLAGMEEDMTICHESIPQDFHEPCCLIELVSIVPERTTAGRITENVTMSATLFLGSASGEDGEIPCEDEAAAVKRKCRAAAELPERLEVIELPGGRVRGTKISCGKSDGRLVCTVTYPVRLITEEETENMETIVWKGDWKNGKKKERQ